MRNWRELGEVPDSENDDSSSDETDYNNDDHEINQVPEPDLPQQETTTVERETPIVDPSQNAADVWSVPSSSPELGRHHLTSSTRKQPQTNSTKPGSPLQKTDSSVEKDFLEDEISKSYVRDTTPESPLSSLSSISSLPGSPVLPRLSLSPTRVRPSPSRAPSTPPRVPSSQPGIQSSPPLAPSNPPRILSSLPQRREIPHVLEDDEELSRSTAMRLERSLRPRKPIQQHPYLLENAQYATFMKSHGVKPIKVVQASQSTERGEEEDSQEKEFQDEESQETPVLFDDCDVDELALSPSLPKTSPGRNLRTSSQRSNGGSNTDATSMSDGEDFPALNRLKPLSVKKRSRTLQSLKRPSSTQQLSARRKRPRVIPDDSSPVQEYAPRFIPPFITRSLPSSPLARELSLDDLEAARRSPTRRLARAPSVTILEDVNGETPVVIEDDDQSELSDAESNSSGKSSGSESEVVRQQSRRIRGVLPASWLRLNQPAPKAPVRQSRQSPEPSPEPVVRKGVALPRSATQRPPTSTQFLFDESEESDEPSALQSASTRRPPSTAPANTVLIEDDASSGMEDDHVDWMLPVKKRYPSNLNSGRSKKQKQSSTQSVFKGRPGEILRQPKITSILSRSESAATSTTSRTKNVNKPRRSTTQSRKKRAATPPLLSILDVMDSNAPTFIKIAARTAKKKKTMGKSSPSNKVISLASRADNIDALSTLRDWKSGKTRPKVAVELSKRPPQPKQRSVLRAISNNVSSRPHLPPVRRTSDPTHPEGYLRQSNLEGFVLVGDENDELPQQSEAPPPAKPPIRKKPVQERGPWMRPAQLEQDEDEDKRRQLNARKRRLDAFYKRTQQVLNLPDNDGPRNRIDLDFTLRMEPAPKSHDHHPKISDDSPPTAKERPQVTKSRYRKTRRPRQVDTEAPQYARANDPLPADVLVVHAEDPKPDEPQDKLKGLGPYGTIYTQHFDVFPLDVGVFFHQSTVIGRGLLQKALEVSFTERMRHQKASVSWTSGDGVVFRWGVWDEKSSSELGILVDWIGDQLSSAETAATLDGRRAVDAADFIVSYVLDSLSLPDDIREKAFVTRCLEVFTSFISRFDSLDWENASSVDSLAKRFGVASRFSVVMLAVRSLSQAGSNTVEAMQVENVITKLCRTTVKRLLGSGLDELRELYGDLQQSLFRERGIRSDRVLPNCWVIVMRVLESVNIPRSSFWDLTQSVMLSDGVASGLDAQAFERLWQDMFTLLPLCEIDNSGILIPGLRKTAPMEGWALPQRLLKRTFELYQGNPRQPASFNEYCRALVARCHFLVQQWGWRKYIVIIGTIFDFFGSQNLANLRNEEVYKSPKFLEELDSGKPSLFIEPEDRCFHIFIKLVALAIQRMKELGRVNDIRNLVARILPNHNREYRKEDTIHQYDLAALRNHHDLLSTLFWVAPPDLRPAVHLIEKLVVPARAHKEACLISIRAWSQLARFIISNGEGVDAFRPFAVWRNNIFNQVLDQYLSAASDIEQQFRDLSHEGFQGISKEMRDDMIAKNKASALDVLSLSIKTSLVVLKRAPTLEAAMYGLNTTQLQKVFTSLDFHSPKFDWTVLSVALDTFGDFIARIDQASEEQYSSEFLNNTQAVDSRTLEEAILMVNEQLSRDFFWMSRTIISLPVPDSLLRQTPQALCIEKTITLAARLASRFIKDRLTKLSSYFTPGKYCLFSALPKDLSTPERKWLPLFLAILLKNQIFDFRDIGTSLLGLWILSIVKPLPLLQYENYLAQVLKHQNLPFIQSATVPATSPDYNTVHDFFLSALLHMRSALRSSPTSSSRRTLREEFSSILSLAQARIKSDLQSHPGEATGYIPFIQQLISLLKSHGVNICTIDPFFLQPSATYSPPMHDLTLHAAGIVAYGVRLSEKDASAGPQLFWYLWNSFKLAFGNGKLKEEINILRRVIRENKSVRKFVMGNVLPAVVMAVTAGKGASNGWVLLQFWVKVLEGVLRYGASPVELREEDEIEGTGIVLQHVGRWLDWVLGESWMTNLEIGMDPNDEPTLAQMRELLRLLRPSVLVCLDSSGGEDENLRKGLEILEVVSQKVRKRWAFKEVVPTGHGGRRESEGNEPPPEIQNYARMIRTDLEKNWWLHYEEGIVKIRMATAMMPVGTSTVNHRAGSSSIDEFSAWIGFTPWREDGMEEVLDSVVHELVEWKRCMLKLQPAPAAVERDDVFKREAKEPDEIRYEDWLDVKSGRRLAEDVELIF